jgi:hypothetical protein
MSTPHSSHREGRTPPQGNAFADRVMAAVRPESPPTPTRAFVSAVRDRSVPNAASALWVAWHLGTVRNWRISPRVRVRSIALVLSVALALGIGSIATGAAVQVVATGINEWGEVQNSPPSGTDEQGEVPNNGSTTPDGVDGPATNQPTDTPEGAATDQPGADQPNGAGTDQPGADQPTQTPEGAGTDQPGANQPTDTPAGAAENQSGFDRPSDG